MRNLVDLAIEAHGGLKLWPEIKEVELKLSLTGVLFQVIGYSAGLPNITMQIAARTADVDFAISATRADRPLHAAAGLD